LSTQGKSIGNTTTHVSHGHLTALRSPLPFVLFKHPSIHSRQRSLQLLQRQMVLAVRQSTCIAYAERLLAAQTWPINGALRTWEKDGWGTWGFVSIVSCACKCGMTASGERNHGSISNQNATVPTYYSVTSIEKDLFPRDFVDCITSDGDEVEGKRPRPDHVQLSSYQLIKSPSWLKDDQPIFRRVFVQVTPINMHHVDEAPLLPHHQHRPGHPSLSGV
jgi:hypothetical protein